MSDLDGLLAQIPIGDIAKKLGIDESVAESAVKQVLPTLVGGLAANSADTAGAASLEKALAKHTSKPTKVAAVADIDTADGDKIVNNVFGSKKTEVAAAVAEKSGSNVTQDIIAKVLPIVAPIVLAWLAQQFLGKKDAAAPAAAPAASGGIGDLLGGLLGGSSGSSGGIGDLLGGLGGLLGGGKK